MMEEDWQLISFVSRSKYRTSILKRLYDKPSTPSKISEDLSIPRPSTSQELKQLEEKDLVKKLTEARKGRFYDITDKGKKILKKVEDLE